MGERAECVMLNKGPYVVTVVRTLDDILRRMQGHQEKMRSMLRQTSPGSRFSRERGNIATRFARRRHGRRSSNP